MGEVAFALNSCVRGYHVYQDLWDATPGETLTCIRERGNRNDVFAVAVQSDGNVVGHVPRHISCICTLFMHRGGEINCLITGSRRYSRDLPQGGMEIPCKYTFSGNKDLVEKIRGRLEELQEKVSTIKKSSRSDIVSTSSVSVTTKYESTSACAVVSMKESSTLLQSPEGGDNSWVKIKDISLKINDRTIIEQGLELTDLHINSPQRLIKNQFPKLNGLKLSLLQAQPLKGSTINAIQIFHVHGNHWIVAATSKHGKTVQVYDSAHTSLDHTSAVMIKDFFRCSLSNIKAVAVQKQRPGSNDCGVYAIANATTITFGEDPVSVKYDQSVMRSHLIECFTSKKMEFFPLIKQFV